MTEAAFESLSGQDRHEVLTAATFRSGRPTVFLEKDIWVVQALRVLFGSPFGENLVLKGG